MKESPAEAEIISHKLLLRAGLVRKLTGGLYTFLPAGLRALKKVEQIVREEMDRAGALEVFMPALQPPDIWEKSGRLESAQDVLFHVKDRGQKDWVLGPTHEEVITTMVSDEFSSYRQLPINFYQIQTKPFTLHNFDEKPTDNSASAHKTMTIQTKTQISITNESLYLAFM